ncbi:thiamine pyrophosphate-dependent enzyme [Mycolicibacterium monacense]|uniref:thiamine pyrophosphate-dependent enzyme n=1 Tax=Mycolicibacterium monacense TaxID=85693 RepID=UPI0022A7FBBE|nr:thiamine pyrophosphate-dependent enzyme [Mycolicibacterium monacense]
MARRGRAPGRRRDLRRQPRGRGAGTVGPSARRRARRRRHRIVDLLVCATPPVAAGVPAHLSGYLASMGCALPYGVAAKLDAPQRPVVALVGDGAMQMSGLLELVTIADRWRSWQDPRFVVLVLHNADLTEVSWEQREMEGNPRFAPSQDVPRFPYAGYAELLGLRGIRVTSSQEADDAWATAFSADRPTVIEAVVDAATPLLPPLMPDSKADKVRAALEQEART